MKLSVNRTVLLSLVSAVLVGAVAVFSGIPWSQASESQTGVELVANDQGASLSVTGIQPGDRVTRTVTIRNRADQPARVAFTEQGAASALYDGQLTLVITRVTAQDDRQIYAGRFGAMADLTQDMGLVEAGGELTFRFTVSLSKEAHFQAPGGQSALVSYAWVMTPS